MVYYYLDQAKICEGLDPEAIAPVTDFITGRFLFCIEPLSKPL
jgi:hypothetical protein